MPFPNCLVFCLALFTLIQFFPSSWAHSWLHLHWDLSMCQRNMYRREVCNFHPTWLKDACRVCSSSFLFFSFLSLLIYFFLRDSMSREGQREREWDRESKAGSVQTAESLTWGSNLWTVRSWPKLKQTLNWLSHPGAPPPPFPFCWL